jgi:hypothetical protein
MILENPEIKSYLAELRQEFETLPKLDWYDEYLKISSNVDEWKFSSGDYFFPIPYSEESNGSPSARLMKRSYKNVDQARWLGRYCAGFLAGKHLVTVMPSEPNMEALDACLFSAKNPGTIEFKYINCKFIDTPSKRESKVAGMHRWIDLKDNNKLHLGVGERGAGFIFLYKYSSGQPIMAQGYTSLELSGGIPDFVRFFHYDNEGNINKVTSSASLIWSKAS